MTSQFRRGIVPTCRNLELSRATQSTSAAILMPNSTSDSTSARELWTANTRRRLHARQRAPPKSVPISGGPADACRRSGLLGRGLLGRRLLGGRLLGRGLLGGRLLGRGLL